MASPIAAVTAAAEAAEGDYRRQLIELNISAESIAMSGDAAPEAAVLSADLAKLLKLRGRIVVLHFFLNLLVYFMDYAGSVVNYLILATAVVAGVFSSHAEVIVAVRRPTHAMSCPPQLFPDDISDRLVCVFRSRKGPGSCS